MDDNSIEQGIMYLLRKLATPYVTITGNDSKLAKCIIAELETEARERKIMEQNRILLAIFGTRFTKENEM